jgi:Flp pilus assembly pilin Flp
MQVCPAGRKITERRKAMNELKEMVAKFVREEDGTTAVEYAVMLAFIAVGVIAAVTYLQGAVSGKMTSAADLIAGTTAAPTPTP